MSKMIPDYMDHDMGNKTLWYGYVNFTKVILDQLNA